MADEEVPLTGGNMTSISRIGATVRRPAGPWTPAVHALLRHLEAVGFEGAPRVLGFDERGREVLSYIEGEAGFFSSSGTIPLYLWSDEVLIDAARLLRRLHDATCSFKYGPDAVWQLAYPDYDEHEVVCHNDFAPYNTVFHAGRLHAVIDFDTAGPGPRVWDVAYAAYRFVPLAADERCRSFGLPEPPDRGRRLRLFCDEYGLTDRKALLPIIEQRVAAIITMIVDSAAAGDQRFQMHLEEGHVAGYMSDLAFLRRHRCQLQRDSVFS